MGKRLSFANWSPLSPFSCFSRSNRVECTSSADPEPPARPHTPSTCRCFEQEAITSNDVRLPIHITGKLQDMVDYLWFQIQACHHIDQFEKVYLSELYQMCIKCIEDPQTGKDRNVWAKQWAERLSQGDYEASILNNVRRECLRLLYAMCNCWKPKDPSRATVSDADIIDIFKPQKIRRILSVCLPMDRANALYNMLDDKTNQPGMHWYSYKDVSWFEQNGQGRRNVHTINKRLNWLFELDGLGLSSDNELVGYMTPCRTPFADQVIQPVVRLRRIARVKKNSKLT